MGDGMTYQQKLARWLANHLPRRVVYFAVVRARDEATTGQWSDIEAPGITVSAALSRLHVNMRDRKNTTE